MYVGGEASRGCWPEGRAAGLVPGHRGDSRCQVRVQLQGTIAVDWKKKPRHSCMYARICMYESRWSNSKRSKKMNRRMYVYMYVQEVGRRRLHGTCLDFLSSLGGQQAVPSHHIPFRPTIIIMISWVGVGCPGEESIRPRELHDGQALLSGVSGRAGPRAGQCGWPQWGAAGLLRGSRGERPGDQQVVRHTGHGGLPRSARWEIEREKESKPSDDDSYTCPYANIHTYIYISFIHDIQRNSSFSHK